MACFTYVTCAMYKCKTKIYKIALFSLDYKQTILYIHFSKCRSHTESVN